jgi:phenylalanyl-tRNA synthetase alpha chain
LERRVLETLKTYGTVSFEQLVQNSKMEEDQVRRTLQWLSSKKLVSTSETKRVFLQLVELPPEQELLGVVRHSSNGLPIANLKEKFDTPEKFSAAFGRARAAGWIRVGSDPDQTVTLGNDEGAKLQYGLTKAAQEQREERDVAPQFVPFLPDLLKRGLVLRNEKVDTSVAITPAGVLAISVEAAPDQIDRLTPETLTTGSWKGKKLRPIDVEAKAARIYPGRRHPVRDFINEVRETYISMGFIELQGNSVHPAFWNFDALFIPQDHPGRDMQDTLYLDGLSEKGMTRSGVVANVASTHENGWKTGSKGWGYSWQIEEARRLVLRTHNTVLTVKALSESKEKETRVFAVSKVYRNENLDYKHLAEFYQMDGIIVGEGLNVRHLMGFLTEFYKKLGMKDVKLWPSYFPYTEPSLQVMGYSKEAKSWIELSGSGVFRPEVTMPLGVKVPVLAWGPGIERLMLLRYGLEDMRDLYGGDLSWLRTRREIASSSD